MRYTPPQASGGTVELPYTAQHRNGFATYSFTVKRGINVVTPPTSAGPVGAGSFAPQETVVQLLSAMPAPAPALDPPCTIGASLEELYVAATAIDGWGSYLGYDASDSRAFTLAPK